MELIFIRHGHGEHLLDYPNRLNTIHPGLTKHGVHQINQVRCEISIVDDDLIIVSPTKRTIQTAEQLSQTNNYYVSPFVGPRMYPQDPKLPSLLCDQIYSRVEMLDVLEESRILDFGLTDWGEGINRISSVQFENYGTQLLEWCLLRGQRTLVISHDGTITSYRLLLGEVGLSRKDFLGEAGIFKTQFEGNSKKA